MTDHLYHPQLVARRLRDLADQIESGDTEIVVYDVSPLTPLTHEPVEPVDGHLGMRYEQQICLVRRFTIISANKNPEPTL